MIEVRRLRVRYRKILLCLGLALLVVAGAGAQDNRFRIGLGVGISRELPFYYWGSEFPGFLMPLDFSNFTLVLRTNNIRIEPNFEWLHEFLLRCKFWYKFNFVDKCFKLPRSGKRKHG